MMNNSIQAGTLAFLSAIVIGTSVGLALLFSSILIGKCFAAIGIVESLSLFAFVFALLLI
jgi:V/A-type H+-transporting ATPase subunit K